MSGCVCGLLVCVCSVSTCFLFVHLGFVCYSYLSFVFDCMCLLFCVPSLFASVCWVVVPVCFCLFVCVSVCVLFVSDCC